MRLTDDCRRHVLAAHKRENKPSPCQVCHPGSCGSMGCNVSKRSPATMEELVHGTAEENPSMGQGLLRRLLPNPRQDKVGQYLEKQSEKPTLQPLCPFEAGGFDSPSFCYQTSFAAAELTKGQFLAGTARTELVGCTVLAVVSARAVYIVRRALGFPCHVSFMPASQLTWACSVTLGRHSLRTREAPAWCVWIPAGSQHDQRRRQHDIYSWTGSRQLSLHRSG